MENTNERSIDITQGCPGKVVYAFKDTVADILEDVYDLLRPNTSSDAEEKFIEDMRNKLDKLHNMIEREYNE